MACHLQLGESEDFVAAPVSPSWSVVNWHQVIGWPPRSHRVLSDEAMQGNLNWLAYHCSVPVKARRVNKRPSGLAG